MENKFILENIRDRPLHKIGGNNACIFIVEPEDLAEIKEYENRYKEKIQRKREKLRALEAKYINKIGEKLIDLPGYYWSSTNNLYFPAKIVNFASRSNNIVPVPDIQLDVSVLHTVRKLNYQHLCSNSEDQIQLYQPTHMLFDNKHYQKW